MISFSSFCDGNTKSCHKSQAVKSKLSIVTSNNITTSNDQSVKEQGNKKGIGKRRRGEGKRVRQNLKKRGVDNIGGVFKK